MDYLFMQRAIELAEKGRGRTSPNPLVGAVIVKDGEIVAEGYHQKAGGPHAEVDALSQAGKMASGAMMYVTLEPCCFQGRTPACTGALTKSGIREVIIGMEDPNPRVCGKGILELEESGIKVKTGILEEEISRQNEIYIKYITTGYPFVLLKAAMSLDGKIAIRKGKRTQISSKESIRIVHELRDQHDAVIVGIGTVLIDDPLLTSRVDGKETNNPLRVVIDSNLRIPLDSKIVESAGEIDTLIACANIDKQSKTALEKKGVEVLYLPGRNGLVDISGLLKELGKRNVASVLWEGGAAINSCALKEGLIDKMLLFIAPAIFGNSDAPGLVGSSCGFSDGDYTTRIASIGKSGDDLMVEAYPIARKYQIL